MEVDLVRATWAIVIATIVGPILAVQAERFLARRREERGRQVGVFRTLMATRLQTLSLDHVNALNAVPLEFVHNEKVMGKWRAYLKHLGSKPIDEAWANARVDLLTDLLVAMATSLGYSYEALQIKTEIYSPTGHARVEADAEVIRAGLAAIMKGEKGLPLEVRSIAQDEDAARLQTAVNKALLRWLTGQTAINVHATDVPPEREPE